MGVFEHWPNRITALRILGALGVFAILAAEGNREAILVSRDRSWIHWAFWAFVVVAASDVLDGWLARRGNHVTAFGRIADPFVDKLLVMGTMVFLAVMPWSRPWFPAWIVVVVLARAGGRRVAGPGRRSYRPRRPGGADSPEPHPKATLGALDGSLARPFPDPRRSFVGAGDSRPPRIADDLCG